MNSKSQVAMRVTEETKAQYKEFCAAQNCTQDAGLVLLLQIQQMKEAEEKNPARAENLASFRLHLEALLTLQVASITMADDARALARKEFAVQLDQDAQLIRTLQDNVERSAKELADAHEAKNIAETEVTQLRDKVSDLNERMSYVKSQLNERDNRIRVLAEELTKAEGLPARYQNLLETANELQQENKALLKQVKDNEITYMRTVNALEKDLYQLRLGGAKPQGSEAK